MAKTEQVFDNLKRDVHRLVFANEETDVKDVYKIITERYNFTFAEDDFVAIASENPDNPDEAIINARYNDSQLNILEDIDINDWTASECVRKKTHFMWGRHGKTTLDTKLEYQEERLKRKALKMVYKNQKYTQVKIAIDNLNCEEEIDLHQKGTDGTISALVYGRAAIQKVYDGLTQAELEEDSVIIKNARAKDKKIPMALKLLNSRRLGRIKVNAKTNKIIAVEYLDVKKEKDGQVLEATDEERFLPIEDLIYIVDTNGNTSTNAQFTGVSRYESIVNISMVKRIIMNQNIKEAAKTHYAGLLIAQFPEDTDTGIMTGWIANAAKAAGRWFAHKLQVKIDHWKADTDLDKYSSLVELLDDAIMKAIGVPSALLGKETVKYSNMEELLIAWREGELQFWRTWAKGWLQRYYLTPLFKKLIKVVPAEQIEKPEDQPPEPEYQTEEQEQDDEPPTENPDAEDQIIITDADVKVSYEFQDISFLTKKDILESLKLLKVDLGVPITTEMILRVAGYDEWVEEIMQNEEQEKLKKEKEKKEQIEKMKEAMKDQEENPDEYVPGSFPMARPIPAMMKTNPNIAGASEYPILVPNDPKYAELINEKIKTLQAIRKKLDIED